MIENCDTIIITMRDGEHLYIKNEENAKLIIKELIMKINSGQVFQYNEDDSIPFPQYVINPEHIIMVQYVKKNEVRVR